MTLMAETMRQIDDLVARTQVGGRAPIVTAAVIRDGELTHFSGAGIDPATDEIPNLGMQFRIGSISKTMTAVLLMQLRDEDRLALDDLLYRHLPGTPVGSAITLRQMLGHVSGLQREPDGEWWERSTGPELEAFLEALTPDKIAYPPHRTYHYSNLAYGLLGAVLHRVTGVSWADQLSKRLFEPLGMNRTTYMQSEPFARGYVVHPWHGTLNEEPRTDTGAMAPAGQLWSTPADLAKWASFLISPDPQVLAPATLDEMCAPIVISDLDKWTSGHGLGLEMYRTGERVYIGHGGSMPGYLAHLLVHRPSRTGVVVFATAYSLQAGFSISGLSQSLLTLVLDAEPPRPTPWTPQPTTDTHELSGPWWWMGRETVAHQEGEELVFTHGGTPWRFRREAEDTWRCHTGANEGELLRIKRTEQGTPIELDIATFIHTRTPR